MIYSVKGGNNVNSFDADARGFSQIHADQPRIHLRRSAFIRVKALRFFDYTSNDPAGFFR
jgi:hypothetical protein